MAYTLETARLEAWELLSNEMLSVKGHCPATGLFIHKAAKEIERMAAENRKLLNLAKPNEDAIELGVVLGLTQNHEEFHKARGWGLAASAMKGLLSRHYRSAAIERIIVIEGNDFGERETMRAKWGAHMAFTARRNSFLKQFQGLNTSDADQLTAASFLVTEHRVYDFARSDSVTPEIVCDQLTKVNFGQRKISAP